MNAQYGKQRLSRVPTGEKKKKREKREKRKGWKRR